MKNKLWGGRFSKPTHQTVKDFTRSIQYDQALASYDCLGSLYHIAVLKKAKLLSVREYAVLKKGLTTIYHKIKSGKFKVAGDFEDIHSYIQYLLKTSVGSAALKLQTCRSRNDQVVLGTKLYCLDHIRLMLAKIKAYQTALQVLSRKNKKIFIPGYTHLQHAMPVSASDYFSAYEAMALRDAARLEDTYRRIQLSMGSGALAGTMIPASTYFFPASGDLPKAITPPENALDTVSDRDFIIETLSNLAILGMHLSRISEDLILWATSEFGFIEIDDAFCTGSSLMPQKKNPDVLELIRGYSGRLYGRLLEVLVLMKGLPLSYNRDMQLDKEPLFEALDVALSSLTVLTELLKNLKFNTKNIERQLADESLYATDMAHALVCEGLTFHHAHEIIGKLIRVSQAKKISIQQMNDHELKTVHPLLSVKLLRPLFNAEHSIKLKKSIRRKRI